MMRLLGAMTALLWVAFHLNGSEPPPITYNTQADGSGHELLVTVTDNGDQAKLTGQMPHNGKEIKGAPITLTPAINYVLASQCHGQLATVIERVSKNAQGNGAGRIRIVECHDANHTTFFVIESHPGDGKWREVHKVQLFIQP